MRIILMHRIKCLRREVVKKVGPLEQADAAHPRVF